MVVFVGRIVVSGYLLDVCYFVDVYMDIVRVSGVLARVDYMAYTCALMMFWILGRISTNCMFFSLGYRLSILLNFHLLCQIVG